MRALSAAPSGLGDTCPGHVESGRGVPAMTFRSIFRDRSTDTQSFSVPVRLRVGQIMLTVALAVPIVSGCATGGNDAGLRNAATTGNLARIRSALEEGANMDATDESGRTAMMFAAELGHPAAVRLLADRAADVSLRDLSGESAMDKARNNNHGNVTSILDQVPCRERTRRESSG